MKSSKHMLFMQLTLVCGVLLCAVFGVNAQATSNINSSSEKVEYVTVDIALERLDQVLQTLKEEMAGLPSGSQLYKQAEAKYAYLDSIRRIISSEKTDKSEDIANAIQRAMGIYASDVYGTVPEQHRQNNKQYAIDLLRL